MTLRDALARARFEPPFNVCASCHHGGWDHDLNNRCLIPDCGDRFSEMTDDEKWAFGLAALRADPAVTEAFAEALREVDAEQAADFRAGDTSYTWERIAARLLDSLLGAP